MVAGDPCPPNVRRYTEDREQNLRIYSSSTEEGKKGEKDEGEHEDNVSHTAVHGRESE